MENEEKNLLILTAPPASGKTFWIKSFGETLSEDILIISPLRALADECHSSWPKNLKVMTPEEWSIKKEKFKIVIFDEFHLYHHWGNTFRPLMWEVYFELYEYASLTILLTATFSKNIKAEVEDFIPQYHQVIWCDLGNMRLKYNPSNYYKIPHRKMMEDLIFNLPRPEGVTLVFCQYRHEVHALANRLRSNDLTVWDCVGGEAKEMRIKMASGLIPDFIMATTVLSHGVNLPTIKRVHFLYAVKDADFWIQMVARGGRRGEEYQVFGMENPEGIKFSKWNNLLAIQWLSLKMFWYSIPRQIHSCFLKA